MATDDDSVAPDRLDVDEVVAGPVLDSPYGPTPASTDPDAGTVTGPVD